MARRAPEITVSDRQAQILDKLEGSHKAPQQLIPRIRIILRSGQGVPNKVQAAELHMTQESIGRWRRRWADGQEALAAAEEKGISDLELERMIVEVLADLPRCGAPPRFDAPQLVHLFALACTPPEESGVPLSHWTPGALARELTKRKIVDSISERQVARFLKGGGYSAPQGQVLAAPYARRPEAVRAGGTHRLRGLRAGHGSPRPGHARHQL